MKDSNSIPTANGNGTHAHKYPKSARLDEQTRVAVESIANLVADQQSVLESSNLAISRMKTQCEEKLMKMQSMMLRMEALKQRSSGMKMPLSILIGVIMALDDPHATLRVRGVSKFVRDTVDYCLGTPACVSMYCRGLAFADAPGLFDAAKEPGPFILDTDCLEIPRSMSTTPCLLNAYKHDAEMWCLRLALMHKDLTALPKRVLDALMAIPNRLQRALWQKAHMDLSCSKWSVSKLDEVSKTVEWRVTRVVHVQPQLQQQQQQQQQRDPRAFFESDPPAKFARASEARVSPPPRFVQTYTPTRDQVQELLVKHHLDCSERCKKRSVTVRAQNACDSCVRTTIALDALELSELHELTRVVCAFFKGAEDVPLWKKEKVLESAEAMVRTRASGKKTGRPAPMEAAVFSTLKVHRLVRGKRFNSSKPVVSAHRVQNSNDYTEWTQQQCPRSQQQQQQPQPQPQQCDSYQPEAHEVTILQESASANGHVGVKRKLYVY